MLETAVSLGQLLWGTVVLRPYVFVFLSAYLWLATWHLGLGRTLIYLVFGYTVAWLSEVSSIHTGFPYGVYIYIPATRAQELWVLGVPFMDSLSYVFLSYASYSLALLLLSVRPEVKGEPTPCAPKNRCGHRDPGSSAFCDAGHHHRPSGPKRLPLVSGTDLRLSRARGIFRHSPQQLCRLAPGGHHYDHPVAAPGSLVSRGDLAVLGTMSLCRRRLSGGGAVCRGPAV